MTTGEKIKRIRQHRGMTQKELGDAVGLTANRIAQYEMGYRVPKATLLEKMVEAFNVSRECLLEENGMAVAMLEQLFWLDEEMPGDYPAGRNGTQSGAVQRESRTLPALRRQRPLAHASAGSVVV